MNSNRSLFVVDEINKVFDALKADGRPSFFELSAPLPTVGRADTPLAACAGMSVLLKCYASGGENSLHAHPHEDHTFVVLQGEATFHGPNGEQRVIGPLDGVLLPHGAQYRFLSSGAEALVLLRVGARISPALDVNTRVGADGLDLPADSAANKQVVPEFGAAWFGHGKNAA